MNAALEKRIKRQIIGKPHRFLAVTPLGFEQTLISELEYIRQKDSQENTTELPHVTGDGKVEFTAKITEAWKVVAYSRIANRVLMHVADFKAENFRELEKKAAEIPWELYLDVRREARDERYDRNVILSEAKDPVKCTKALNIHVTCKHSRLYHSDAIAERLYNVITQSNTPQNLFVNFLDDRCTIWLDLAGEELYKRGHERFVNEAPLKETIAAAMIFEALHFLPSTSYCLLDLMSGSGTFSLEAAYIANKLIPGKCRDFALKHQPAFKESTWNFLTRQENGRTSVQILTSDISERAIKIIKHNVECSPLANISPTPIAPQLRDFFSYTAKEISDNCGNASPILVLNPPYGKRLDFDAPKLYTKIGRKITELARDLKPLGKTLTVAILAPKDDTHECSKYTCSANLLHECPALSPEHNPNAKCIVTSHGGFSLNVFIARI